MLALHFAPAGALFLFALWIDSLRRCVLRWFSTFANDGKAQVALHTAMIPLRWYAAEKTFVNSMCGAAFVALFGEAEDPRAVGRKRWDMWEFSRTYDDAIWRIERVEVDGESITVQSIPDIGQAFTARIFPINDQWLHAHRFWIGDFIFRHYLGKPPNIGIFDNSDKQKSVERRIAAIAARSSNAFTPTPQMVDAFNAEFSDVLPQMMNLDLLLAEPWGVFQCPPWLLRYSLAAMQGTTVLCFSLENRFTNTRAGIIRSNGDLDWGYSRWLHRWPVFGAWSGGILNEKMRGKNC